MDTKPEPGKKNYKPEEKQSNKVEEPVLAYGSSSFRYSYADYLTWLDDKTREIIDGIVRLMSPAATRKHAEVSSRLEFEFQSFIKKNKGTCKVYHAPFDVRLPNGKEIENDKIFTVVQPDISVVCDLSKLDDRGCIGAPDLVVEIQSPSTARYDLTEKFSVYEKAGVREYWVVFPGMHAITIYQLQPNGLFDNGTPYEFDAQIESEVLNGFKINVKELFEELD
jgi:Uma2 family endonuclease